MAVDLSGGISVEREFMLAERPAEQGIRDAVNVWIEEENALFGMRIGVEALSDTWDRHELWLDIAFADGRLISRRGDGESHPVIDSEGKPTIMGTGPLRFNCAQPFKRWTTSFSGQATETSAAELIANPELPENLSCDVEFEIEMTMAVPPWEPGSMSEEARRVLAGGDGDFVSPRYEQLFRAKGKLRVGGEEFDFAGQGLRIRRTGFRKFEGFTGHSWQSALFPSGKAFGYNSYPPRDDGQQNYVEGYVFDGDGALRPARPVEMPWLRKLTTGGDAVPCALQTDDGEVIRIDGTTFTNTRSRGSTVLPFTFPKVQQAHARYRWGDEEATGMVERSSLPQNMDE